MYTCIAIIKVCMKCSIKRKVCKKIKILDYYLKSVSNISHNGSLLKSCGITLNSISSKMSFTITITNNLDEVYFCPVVIDIPLSTEKTTIYDGSLTLKDTVDYKFIRIK